MIVVSDMSGMAILGFGGASWGTRVSRFTVPSGLLSLRRLDEIQPSFCVRPVSLRFQNSYFAATVVSIDYWEILTWTASKCDAFAANE